MHRSRDVTLVFPVENQNRAGSFKHSSFPLLQEIKHHQHVQQRSSKMLSVRLQLHFLRKYPFILRLAFYFMCVYVLWRLTFNHGQRLSWFGRTICVMCAPYVSVQLKSDCNNYEIALRKWYSTIQISKTSLHAVLVKWRGHLTLHFEKHGKRQTQVSRRVQTSVQIWRTKPFI